MRHLKVLGVALMAMFALSVTALGMTASSASALLLPVITIVLGGTQPLDLHLADNSKTPTRLLTTGGSELSGKGFEVLLLLNAASGSLGPGEVLFLNVETLPGKVKCNTIGDVSGEVLLTGEWHVVPIATSPLVNGVAFLLTNLVVITCGTTKVDVRGCSITKITAENGKQLESTGGILKGTNGIAAQREYLNDNAEATKCVLSSEFSNVGKFAEAEEEVNEGNEFTLTAQGSKMYEFSNLL